MKQETFLPSPFYIHIILDFPKPSFFVLVIKLNDNLKIKD